MDYDMTRISYKRYSEVNLSGYVISNGSGIIWLAWIRKHRETSSIERLTPGMAFFSQITAGYLGVVGYIGSAASSVLGLAAQVNQQLVSCSGSVGMRLVSDRHRHWDMGYGSVACG
jgi:hypothetical protein